ncbi:murein L,D-transpeptidase family protein [Rhodoplanes sp.]|uniref:L,D-transpeptidase family protein n=1 Tax=Rhodoplanes sp. TaxID=1968906 RepID=UPI0025E16B7B|nr:murein L,D-transpeptidase family protein [Rhodoplanes sp.]
MQPLSREMQATLVKKDMPVESPVLLRVFKEEAELEVWKQDSAGQYALLKTYPICRWSGELGPKVKQGDRQAPEGFYTITPGQMNPNSSFHLAFNLGFPNAYDKANDRTGAFLMIHGDCSSSGCYAMTDEQISEIYALGREAFLGGQKSFQVQAYPFRMTGLNMARHRNSPHMAFWRMIKDGNDHFEATRQEPKIDVCEKHYVFNATPVSGRFDPTGRCPAYQVPQDITAAVKDKQDQDEHQFASYVAQGVRTVAVTTGSDGGMHPTFLAKVNTNETFVSNGRKVASLPPLSPGGKPTYVYLPTQTAVASADPETTSGVIGSTRVASADGSSDSSIGAIGKWLGLGGKAEDTPPPPNPKPTTAAKPAAAKPAPKPAAQTMLASSSSRPVALGAIRPTQAPAQVQGQSRAEAKPQGTAQAKAEAKADAAPAAYAGATLLPGAQPVRGSSAFENRWGGM